MAARGPPFPIRSARELVPKRLCHRSVRPLRWRTVPGGVAGAPSQTSGPAFRRGRRVTFQQALRRSVAEEAALPPAGLLLGRFAFRRGGGGRADDDLVGRQFLAPPAAGQSPSASAGEVSAEATAGAAGAAAGADGPGPGAARSAGPPRRRPAPVPRSAAGPLWLCGCGRAGFASAAASAASAAGSAATGGASAVDPAAASPPAAGSAARLRRVRFGRSAGASAACPASSAAGGGAVSATGTPAASAIASWFSSAAAISCWAPELMPFSTAGSSLPLAAAACASPPWGAAPRPRAGCAARRGARDAGGGAAPRRRAHARSAAPPGPRPRRPPRRAPHPQSSAAANEACGWGWCSSPRSPPRPRRRRRRRREPSCPRPCRPRAPRAAACFLLGLLFLDLDLFHRGRSRRARAGRFPGTTPARGSPFSMAKWLPTDGRRQRW